MSEKRPEAGSKTEDLDSIRNESEASASAAAASASMAAGEGASLRGVAAFLGLSVGCRGGGFEEEGEG